MMKRRVCFAGGFREFGHFLLVAPVVVRQGDFSARRLRVYSMIMLIPFVNFLHHHSAPSLCNIESAIDLNFIFFTFVPILGSVFSSLVALGHSPSLLREQLLSLNVFWLFPSKIVTTTELSSHSLLSSVLVSHPLRPCRGDTVVLVTFVVFNSTAAPRLTLVLAHQRYIMSTQGPVRWQCHECNTAPHLCAITIKCTGVLSNGLQCEHEMCPHCKKDNDIPPPLSTGALRSPPIPATTIHLNTIPRTVPSMAPGGNSRNRDRRKYHQLARRLSTRPSRRGWWVCCSCRFANNPALSPERCPDCSHQKCRNCRAWLS